MNEYQLRNTERFPTAIKNLIIINALVWISQITFDKHIQLTEKLGLWPIQSLNFRPYQFITHLFAHSPNLIFHLFFNMFMLWMFGRILENIWGTRKFLIFYFACGVGAAVLYSAITYFSFQHNLDVATQLMQQGDIAKAQKLLGVDNVAIGASGAIMGIMIAFAVMFPNIPLYIFFIPIPIKAKWAIGGMVVFDILFGLIRVPGDDVAHFAHVGGAITGFILVMIWKKKTERNV